MASLSPRCQLYITKESEGESSARCQSPPPYPQSDNPWRVFYQSPTNPPNAIQVEIGRQCLFSAARRILNQENATWKNDPPREFPSDSRLRLCMRRRSALPLRIFTNTGSDPMRPRAAPAYVPGFRHRRPVRGRFGKRKGADLSFHPHRASVGCWAPDVGVFIIWLALLVMPVSQPKGESGCPTQHR